MYQTAYQELPNGKGFRVILYVQGYISTPSISSFEMACLNLIYILRNLVNKDVIQQGFDKRVLLLQAFVLQSLHCVTGRHHQKLIMEMEHLFKPLTNIRSTSPASTICSHCLGNRLKTIVTDRQI